MRRFNVGKFITILFVGIIFSLFTQGLNAQNLEIHYINVQQGQSTLIIGPDGTTILYDGGYSEKGTSEVIPYLQSIGISTSQSLDYIITSHLHTDHYVGLTEVMNGGYDALNVYDNGSDYYNSYVQEFFDAAANTTAGGVSAMSLGQVINLGGGATATCVAVDGSVIGVGAISGGQANENDRSVCLLIKFGDFDFLLTGDVGGGSDDYSCTGRSTSQVNIETPLVQSIMPGGANPLLTAYGVEVAHVSHHGSESSTNSDYMNLMTPSIACICVGDGQSTDWFHPRIDVVDNVLLAQAYCITAPAAIVLQTEEGNPAGSLTSYSGYCVGDIVISTDGINSYSVSASGAVSQGPDERSAAGLPAIYYFDEYTGGDLPAVISNVNEENLTQTSTDIVWTTNEVATSVVRYGTSSGSYPNTVSDATMVTSHRIGLSGLTASTTYYYIVESTDSGSNVSTSNEYSFTTLSEGGSGGSGVVFSEIFYDTPGTDADEEWVELYNNTGATVDIGGWTIIDNNGTGTSFTIPAGSTIQPGTFFTIAANSVGFNALYGYDADLYGLLPYLNNDGDTLLLKNTSDEVVDAVAWEGGASAGIPTGWGSTTDPVAATGSSIVRTDPGTDTDTYADWSTLDSNGNPQVQGSTGTGGGDILFSEIFYDTPGTDADEEWIELYNNSTSAVDISGWTIVDNNGTGTVYTFPSGQTIQPGTYFTVAMTSTGFNALYGYDADLYGTIPFLNNDGDALLLKDGNGDVVDAVAWEGGASSGIPTGWGSTTDPTAPTGSTIVRTDSTVDTDTFADWSVAANNGNPQTQSGGTPATEMFVSNIIVKLIGKSAKATITITDTDNNPVSGATVYITWSGMVSGTDSGTTDTTGVVDFTSPSGSKGTYTVTVDNVTHTSLTYNSSLNIETSDSVTK